MTCENNKKGCNNKIRISTLMLASMVCMLSVSDMFGMEKPPELTDDMIYKALYKKHADINKLLQEVFNNNSSQYVFSYYGCCNMCCCRNPMKFTFEYKQQPGEHILSMDNQFTSQGPYSFFDGVRDTYILNNQTGKFSLTNMDSNVLRLKGMKEILTEDLFLDNDKKISIK